MIQIYRVFELQIYMVLTDDIQGLLTADIQGVNICYTQLMAFVPDQSPWYPFITGGTSLPRQVMLMIVMVMVIMAMTFKGWFTSKPVSLHWFLSNKL